MNVEIQIDVEMKAFQLSLIMLKFIGIDNSFKNYPLKLVYPIQHVVQTVLICFVLIPSAIHIYNNKGDFVEVTDAACIVTAYACATATLWHFLFVKETIINTIDDIRKLMEKSMYFVDNLHELNY